MYLRKVGVSYLRSSLMVRLDPSNVGIFPYGEDLVLRVSEIAGCFSIWGRRDLVADSLCVIRKIFPYMGFRGHQDFVGTVSFMLAPLGFCAPRRPLLRPSGFSSVSLIMWSRLFAWLWALRLLMWDWRTCRCRQCLCMTCLGTRLEIPPSSIMPFLRGKEVGEGGGCLGISKLFVCPLPFS